MPQLAPRLSLRVSQNDNRVHVVLECEALFESYFTPAEADTITFFSGYVAGTPLLWGCIYSGASFWLGPRILVCSLNIGAYSIIVSHIIGPNQVTMKGNY